MDPDTQAAAQLAAAAIEDKKGAHVVVLDVSEFLGITDVFVIGSGSSQRQVKTLAQEVERRMSEGGRRPLHREGTGQAKWVLLDYGDVVVHLFDEETRAYYELERLWGNAPRLDWMALASEA